MQNQRVVVALGGNAFTDPRQPLTMAGQFEFARHALSQLVPLLGLESQVLISHGNGPQVGFELLRVEAAIGQAYDIPLDVCVAQSEAELGYVLMQSLYEVLSRAGQQRPIASLLTQVVVDAADPAFGAPSKPIGAYYSVDQADELRRQGHAVREDAGRGYRRVVASPRPLEVIEGAVIRQLLELGIIVIAAGGGGIPVVRSEGKLRGVEAVIDKDLTSALLADQLEARQLIILTNVPCAFRDYRTPQQAPIRHTTPDALRAMMREGHFAAGSMLPKIEAATRFADRPGRRAIVTSPDELSRALAGEAGTIVATEDS